MKVLEELTLEQKTALKFVLEDVNPNDQKLHITVKDLRQIDKICHLLETEKPRIEFEDDDFRYLKDKFNNYATWNPQMRAVILATADKLSVAEK